MTEALEEERLNEVVDTAGIRAPGVVSSVERLIAMIEAEPVEDGVTHPGEKLMREFLDRYGPSEFLREAFDCENLAATAAMLRLFGRLDAPQADIGRQVLQHGLRSASVEVRDAAVQAVELWGDAEVVPVLRAHREPIAWLAEYVERVAEDLGG